MKKLLFTLSFFALLACSGTSVKAQNASGFAYRFPVIAGDSIVNVDTVFKQVTVTAGYNTISIQGLVSKGTGTLTGKVYLWQSYDKQNYTLTDSATLAVLPTPSYVSTLQTYTYGATITKSNVPGVYYLIGVASNGGSLTSSPVRVQYTLRNFGVKTL